MSFSVPATVDSPHSPALPPVIQASVEGRLKKHHSKTLQCDIEIKRSVHCFVQISFPREHKRRMALQTDSSFPPPVKSAQQKCSAHSQRDDASYKLDVA